MHASLSGQRARHPMSIFERSIGEPSGGQPVDEGCRSNCSIFCWGRSRESIVPQGGESWIAGLGWMHRWYGRDEPTSRIHN